MENASDALLMAGGILLGILTLSAIVYMAGGLGNMGQAQLDEEAVARLAAWNSEWEAYNKKVLYGVDVLTVYNKAEQNNEDYEHDALYSVNVSVIDKDGNNVTDIKKYIVDESRKTSIFKCNTMEPNADTGRIQNIVFEIIE